MKIKDVLQRDPDTFPLVNQGQARIVDSHNAKALEELRGELSTFVCEGQYADGVQRIIRSYLDSLGKTNQKAAWVSGFFGSGQVNCSMLCPVAGHPFPDGDDWEPRPRHAGRVARTPARARHRRPARRRARCGGSLPAEPPTVRLTILESRPRRQSGWYPTRFLPVAPFAGATSTGGFRGRRRHSTGTEQCTSAARSRKRSAVILRIEDAEAQTRKAAADGARHHDRRVPSTVKGTRSTAVAHTLRPAHPRRGAVTGESDRSVLVTEVAEAVCKQLDSGVIIGAGQSATDVPCCRSDGPLQIRVPLSDAGQQVTRKVLLR